MTVKQLRDKLNKLMEDHPGIVNDEIYFWDSFALSSHRDLYSIEKVDIEFDIETIGRYVCLEE